jgi:hypothetical protein
MKKRWPKLIALAMTLLLLGGIAATASAANGIGNSQSNNALCQGLMMGKQKAQMALKVVAEMTGLSTTDIRSQRVEGKSLADIVEANGISEQTVIDEVIAERTDTLDQLKADNKITDDQYQNCISNMQERIKANIERTGIGSANGKQGMGYRQGNGKGQGIGNKSCGCNQNN